MENQMKSIFNRCPQSGQMADDRVFTWQRDSSGKETGKVRCHCGKLVQPRPCAFSDNFDQIPAHNVPKVAS
jgi:hypothetical protein